MSNLDFLVFTLILLFIAFYGVYKNYQNKNLKSYILGDRSLSWSTIGLSVMATQASAITFISTPGQGYAEGMSFIQNYFGMPLALIVVSIFFIPRYYGSKVFTAYQYLEKRFGLGSRLLMSALFMATMVLGASSILTATSIAVSLITGLSEQVCIIILTTFVVFYTMLGGMNAVICTDVIQGIVLVFLSLIHI